MTEPRLMRGRLPYHAPRRVKRAMDRLTRPGDRKGRKAARIVALHEAARLVDEVLHDRGVARRRARSAGNMPHVPSGKHARRKLERREMRKEV